MKKKRKIMQVILIKDVANLGQAGEIKDVKPGYARNFLLAKNLAVLPTDPQAKIILKEKTSKIQESKAREVKMTDAISNLTGKKISFKVKVNAKNVPFKAIQVKEIADKLKISAPWVKTPPLRKIGEHPVLIQSGDLSAKIIVVISPEK
jgi:large subunit ribosomal protein L9